MKFSLKSFGRGERGATEDGAAAPVTSRQKRPFLMTRRAALGALAAAVVGWVTAANAWEVGEGPRYKTLLKAQSEFNGDVRVVEDEFTRYLLFGSSMQTGQSRKNLNYSAFRYVDGFHLGKAAVPDAKSALFIGLGGGMGPRQFHAFYPDIKIDAVEIDPLVAKIAKEHFKLPTDSRLKVTVGDGRAFLKDNAKKYDLIFLDAYDAHSAPPMLTTKEFMQLVHNRLNPNGAMVANVIAAQRGHRSRFGRSEYKTIRSIFQDTAVFPVQSALNPDEDPEDYENLMYVALKGGKLPTQKVWEQRVAKLRRPEIRALTRVVRHGPLRDWPTHDVEILTDANPPKEDLFGN